MSVPVEGIKHGKHKRESVPDRQRSVANAAYYLAEKRGFEPGRELEDWFAAESLIAVSPPGKG